MLRVCNIITFYAKIQVLWDVSFRVDLKEIVALVGTNGAGKTTILKTISNLLHPASGTVEFLGRKIEKIPSHRIVEIGISHVPEGRKLFPDMTVREHLELGAYTHPAWDGKEEMVERVYEIFPRLKERASQLARTLSGGEQQMLAMGRGLMSRPKLCMLDEPSSGLAPLVMKELFEIIKALREQGMTLLLVEQNTERALEVADRAYVLENGRIVLEGKGEELLQNDHVKVAYLGL